MVSRSWFMIRSYVISIQKNIITQMSDSKNASSKCCRCEFIKLTKILIKIKLEKMVSAHNV